jgi:DNA-directed RNA polymerase beta' subunit/intein/homing endonuclease
MGQSIQTMSELMDFASVPYHVLTPKDAKPIIEIIQDTMVGSYRITKAHTRIHEKAFANLQMVNSYFTGALSTPGGTHHSYTGRQAFSAILPPAFYISTTNKSKEKVVIKDSELIEGFIDKDVYNAMSHGIIPVIFHDYGPFEARRFMDNLQRLICRWLMTAGFSVGISDLAVSDEINAELKDVISTMKDEAYKRLDDVRRGRMENTSMFNNQEYFEREIINILNDSMKKAGAIGMKTIDDRVNRLINMVKAGSKGKDLNVSQMIAAVGQQNVDGKRVAYGFTDRTLPHYCKYDDGPEARGFVESSFIGGLSPQEMFFHAMGGREGLIDTAVKSVTKDTALVIIEDGVSKYVKIGEWVDAHLASDAERIKHFPDDRNMELLELTKPVYIPTTDDDGKVTWGELTAVTRHDVGKAVYRVKTLGGREITVADSETLLIWRKDSKKFLKMKTSQVEVGFYVPVTMNLPAPPVEVTYVDMEKYFPKTEYVHGTEYNRACRLMKEAQGDKFHIPRGWWEANNGVTFTTPFPSKARLQRATVRSNVDNILDGCVYPFHAKRDSVRMPDKFDLDYDNGVFIGIYLADGCAHEVSGKVSIAKEDKGVQDFVKKWFDKFNIKSESLVQMKEAKGNFNGGFSYTVEGNSTLMARFLRAFVGTLCHNKFVPDVAFNAPIEFVKGIICGYFTGDGTIDKNSVSSISASRRLTEGISMLCTRLGIFGNVSKRQQTSNNLGTEDIKPGYNLDIRSLWGQKFADNIELVMDHKNESLHTAAFTKYHRNFDYQNDVVMDRIVEIYKVDVKDFPKLYDVTVPSTLNFGIANGMQLQDTSETGYIQRRLIKAMEDAKIYYDQTVRNAAGSVVQFIYGEDGMEGTKIEKQLVPTIDKNIFEIDADYHLRTRDPLDIHLAPEAMEAMKTEGPWAARATAHFEKLLEDRAYLIEQVFRGEKNNKVYYPIPFERIIKTVHERAKAVGIADLPTDLTPTIILDGIDGIINELMVIQPGQGTFYLELLTRVYLSPKPLLFKYHMKKDTFAWVLSEVRRYFAEAIASPGEMVGIIAAQSVGEPLSQLTLDSFHVSGTAAAVKATSGVPRIKELLSVSKNMKKPSHLIYLKPDIGTVTNPNENDEEGVHADPRVREAKERAMQVLRSLETTRLEDIIASTEIFFDPMADDAFDTTLTEDQRFLDVYRAFEDVCPSADGPTTPWVLRMTIDRAKLHAARLTMTELYLRIIAGNPHIRCLFSDDNASELVMRIKLIQEDDKPIEDHVAALKALEQTLTHKPTKGVDRIRKVSMHVKNSEQYNKATQAFEKRSEWVLDTDGSNFAEILANPNIDATRTITNDPREINAVLGIEAARNSLHFEIMDVIRESSVNFRHLSLLIDTMTHRGTLMPIDRHGINRGDVGPLAKSSFEETTDMLINASVFSDYDRVNGVSSTIMLGQLPPCGTGDCEILLDEDAYMGMLKNVRNQLKTIKETDAETEGDDESDGEEHESHTDPCAISALEFKYKPAYKQTIGNAFGVPEVGF